MKVLNLIVAAGVATVMASCGNSIEEVKVEMKTLSLDTKTSTLAWVGSKTPEYFHAGTVGFSEGTAEFVDGEMTSGKFSVDMSSITSTDAGLPKEKQDMLVGHLASPDFFDVAKNAKVEVSCEAPMNGKLPIVISISGKKISQEIPVKVKFENGKASIAGQFEVDFAALNVKGFQPNPEMPNEPAVSSKIKFDLKLDLK